MVWSGGLAEETILFCGKAEICKTKIITEKKLKLLQSTNENVSIVQMCSLGEAVR